MQVGEVDKFRKIQFNKDIFFASLSLLLFELSNSSNEKLKDSCNKFIKSLVFDEHAMDLEIAIFKKYNIVVSCNFNLLQERSVKLFQLKDSKNKKITLIPGIDISYYDGDYSVLWPYLEHMYDSSVALSGINLEVIHTNYNFSHSLFKRFYEIFATSKLLVYRPELNPHLGVGENNNYSVSDLLSGPELLQGQSAPPSSIEDIIGMFGIDPIAGMDKFSEQIQNMTDSQMDSAVNQIKSMLKNAKPETVATIETVMQNIKDELVKSKETIKTNPKQGFSDFMKVAKSVAEKMGPEVAKNNIDVKDLFNQAKVLSENAVTPDGKPMFKNSPFSAMTGIIERKMNNEPDNPDRDMKECVDAMNNMGINVNPNDMKNIDINKLLSALKK